MDEFLYSSARIRALENGLCTKDRLDRLIEAGSIDRCLAILSEFGVPLKKDLGSGLFSREATLADRLQNAYREVADSAPEATFLKLWLYPYDCNNIKSAIKCARRGIAPDEMMFDFGTLDPKVVIQAVQEKDFEKLEPFARAAKEADEAYATSKNPQWVDLILDIDCYRQMATVANESEIEFVIELVKSKIDYTNIMMCVRLLRMGNREAGRIMLGNALLPDGTLDKSLLCALYDNGENALWEKLSYSRYQKFAAATGGQSSTLSKIERAADNAFLEEVAKAKMIPYGPETLVAYLLKVENEVRNLRIILAGLEAKLPVKTIRERIRMSDV